MASAAGVGAQPRRPRHPPRAPLHQRPHHRLLLRAPLRRPPQRRPPPAPALHPLPPLQPPRPSLRRRPAPPVLLPVNDNPDASVAEGGSHWTFLVLDSATSPSAPRFVHHDSLRGAPNLHLADALRPLLQCDSGTVPLVQGHTPRQTNGYDCGVYVMAICAWWNDAQDHRTRGGVRREVDARSVKAMRTDLLQLINTLIQEKAKPNSTSEGDTDRGSSD